MNTGISDSEEHLRNLRLVIDSELAHLELDEMLEQSLQRVQEAMAADTVAVLLLDPSRQTLIATAARGLEEEVRQGVRVPLSKGFAGRIAAERRPIALDEVDTKSVVNPILWRRGIRALLGAPLVVEGRVIGVIHVGSLQPRTFTDDDIEMLQVAADRIALALSARLEDEVRSAASTLQRSLLPPVLPSIPGFDLAARYSPGDGDVGGDWYDVFPLSDRAVGLAVGDVAGKGLGPATVMGRTRTALRAYALETDSPALVLGRVHRMLRQFEDEQMVTVIYGVLNPVEKTIVMCSAGHLPPLLALPDGSTEYVDIEPGPPMGLGPELERRDVSLEIPEGATLFLYTDGLIERRGVPMDQGLEQLSRVVSTRPAEEACAEILQALMGNESLLDDIALLAVRRLAEEPEAPVS